MFISDSKERLVEIYVLDLETNLSRFGYASKQNTLVVLLESPHFSMSLSNSQWLKLQNYNTKCTTLSYIKLINDKYQTCFNKINAYLYFIKCTLRLLQDPKQISQGKPIVETGILKEKKPLFPTKTVYFSIFLS